MVQGALSKVLLEPMQIEWLQGQFSRIEANRLQDASDLITAKELALGNINERLTRLTDAYIDRMIDKETFDARNQALLHERTLAQEMLEASKADLNGKSARARQFLQLSKDIFQAGELGSESEKRDILKSATSNLRIDGKELVVTWFPPFQEVARSQKSIYGAPHRDTSPTKQARSTRFAIKLFDLIQGDLSPVKPSYRMHKKPEGRESCSDGKSENALH